MRDGLRTIIIIFLINPGSVACIVPARHNNESGG